MSRSFVAAAAALFMVGFCATAQAKQVKVFHSFYFGDLNPGADREACYADRTKLLEKVEKQRRLFDEPDFSAFKKQRGIVRRSIKAFRRDCGQIKPLVKYRVHDPVPYDPDPVDPDTVDPVDGDVTTKVVVDMIIRNDNDGSICHRYFVHVETGFRIHQMVTEAARRGDKASIDQVESTYRMLTYWFDRFTDAKCGPAELAIERMTF